MKKKFSKGKIIISIFTVVLVALCGGIYVITVNKNIISQNKMHIKEVIMQISENISSKIDSDIHNLKLIGDNLVLNEQVSSEALSEVLQFEIKSGLFSEIIVVDLNGNGIDSNNKGIFVGEMEYFKQAKKGIISVTEPIDSSPHNKNIIIYSVPIMNNGEVVGAICGIKNSQLVKEQLSTSIYGNQGCYYITDNQGSMILEKHIKEEHTSQTASFNKIYSKINYVKSQSEDIKNHGISTMSINYEQKYIAYSKVKATNDWYIVMSIPMASVFSDTYKILEITIVVLILCIIIAIIVNIYINKKNYEFDKDLHRAVYEDYLTEINNYEKFIIEGDKFLCNSSESKQILLVFDIEKFKVINDIYGYRVGDSILKEISKNLKFTFEKSAIYGRLTGDTFGILVEVNNIEEDISKLAYTIKHEISDSKNMNSVDINVKVDISIGVCVIDKQNYKDIRKIIDNANRARIKAKSMKYVDYLIFDEEMREEKKNQMKLEQDLVFAIENKEFKVYYQPKFDIRRGQIVGAEALIRWIHPTMGFIGPDKFIPIAEKNGYINEIGKWVFDEVCRELMIWKEEGIEVVPVSVNLSRVELYQEDLIENLKHTLDTYNISPKLLELEITETTTLNDMNFIKSKVYKIKELGIRVSMDDFGVGNSNISNLKDIPMDTLKIDRSILIDIDTNIKSKVVVESILNICRHLDLEVVGEGVENMNQVEILKEIGCNVIQGYVFSKPIDKDRYKSLLLLNKEEIRAYTL